MKNKTIICEKCGDMRFVEQEQDLIFQSDTYKIYKKDAGEMGTIGFMDCFDLIHIGLTGLREWKNQGLRYKKDLKAIFDTMKQQMDEMLSRFEEGGE